VKGAIGLALGTLAISFAAIFVRLSGVGPISTGLWRLTLAFLFVFAWGILFDRKSLRNIFKKENQGWLKLTVLAGLAFGADLVVWHLSIHKTTVAMATLLANFAPFFMLFGAIIFLGEKLHPKSLSGILLCGLGILLLSLRFGNITTPAKIEGNLLALCAAFFYAIYLLILRKAKAKGVSPFYALGVASFSGAALMLPLALIFEPHILWPETYKNWEILFLLGGVSQVLGQGLITAFLPKVSGDLSSAILCLQSIFAAVSGYLILKERLSFTQIVGGAFVIAGIFLVRWAQDQRLKSRPF